MSKKILVCIDGSALSKSVCDYGVFLAKKLDLPLVLLNVIEHSHISKKLDLSGNIGLGARDDLLEELSQEEEIESKELIKKSKSTLKELEGYIKEQGVENSYSIQKHGSLDEILDDLSAETKIAVIGLNGSANGEDKKIGSHIEESVRTLSIPILLVNCPFKPIESILMAYDGSEYANKAIKVATKSPVFPNTKRHIVNVNKDKDSSLKLLQEAKNLFAEGDFEVTTQTLDGDAIESLLKYQDENNIDAIAMGAYSHNRLKSMIFGSFTTKMMQKATKPLILFR